MFSATRPLGDLPYRPQHDPIVRKERSKAPSITVQESNGQGHHYNSEKKEGAVIVCSQ